MRNSKWQYNGDVNMLDYGGTDSRWIGGRRYQFLELINMDDACGRDNEGQPKYAVELRLVDLCVIGQSNMDSALGCCGMETEKELTDEMLAGACNSYGCHAPLGNWTGNNAGQMMREARKMANDLRDESKLESALDKTCNRMGSTAREFMAGDFTSAMQRGCESGNLDARIMAKMHGVTADVINDVRPDDWLPYVFGYMAGLNGGTKETNPDTAAEYFRGFERGAQVKAGKCPAPGWIKSAQPVAA